MKSYPFHFPAGFYCYGGNSKGPRRPSKWVEQLLEENSTQCDVTSDTKGVVNNDAENVHDEDDNIPEELTDTDKSDHSTNCEEEDWSKDEGSPEPQILPAVNRNNTHNGLRQNPCCNQ